jgi:predicted ATPase
VPPLLSLLDMPVEDVGWQTLDPPQRRQRTLDAVKRLLLREAQVRPLLLVFEDLHWIDSETQALLDSLVESLGSARLLLLVNYRPEYRHGWLTLLEDVQPRQRHLGHYALPRFVEKPRSSQWLLDCRGRESER